MLHWRKAKTDFASQIKNRWLSEADNFKITWLLNVFQLLKPDRLPREISKSCGWLKITVSKIFPDRIHREHH
jgi:hypothetical protein